MDLSKRIESFVKLGEFLINFSLGDMNDKHSKALNEIILNDNIFNPWFTKENILHSIKAIGESLKLGKVECWVNKYPSASNNPKSKKVGVITAGNIPLVGFSDFISVLISGHIFKGKLSSKDNRLLKFISDYLIDLNSEFKNYIIFTEDKLEDFDAVIATGSNNTARYFEYYFGKYPHIIRKNRSSAAVLTGDETSADIKKLGVDIFSYFGLGCRNVSKLFIPKDYCFDNFFENIESFKNVYMHNKYANNYDYNKSVYLMNQIQHFDNGFLILKEDENFSSPIGVVFFQYYNNIQKVNELLNLNSELIQCVVSRSELIKNSLYFGKAQEPELWDYADNIDTMKFLLEL
ncbi:MAG: hypothetical protein JEY96_08650 [Bacteroidales bacterium]|nr:hypothetical protein [Bacteroidales bacterium]